MPETKNNHSDALSDLKNKFTTAAQKHSLKIVFWGQPDYITAPEPTTACQITVTKPRNKEKSLTFDMDLQVNNEPNQTFVIQFKDHKTRSITPSLRIMIATKQPKDINGLDNENNFQLNNTSQETVNTFLRFLKDSTLQYL